MTFPDLSRIAAAVEAYDVASAAVVDWDGDLAELEGLLAADSSAAEYVALCFAEETADRNDPETIGAMSFPDEWLRNLIARWKAQPA